MAAKYASRVVAVEPEPSNYSALLSNIRFNSYSNVTALCVALSDRNRKLPLHVAALGNMGSSSLEPESIEQGTESKRGTVEVQCDTLDSIVARLNLESIDWLKIDVERHEIPMLEGAQETLAKARNVILEVSRGNEAACIKLMKRAGLDYTSIDVGARSSNWFLTRN
jgi:FkbM family methyltransferase